MNQDLCGNEYQSSIGINVNVLNKTRFDSIFQMESRLENIVQCQLSLIDDVEI